MPADTGVKAEIGSGARPFVPFPEGLVPVRFVRRRNRFVVEVLPDWPMGTEGAPAGPCPGELLLLHMPNTGRMSELLTPGTLGLAALDGGGARKTAGTLLLVRYEGRWVSVDARMPNRLFAAALEKSFMKPFRGLDERRAEFPWKGGRIDFKLWKSQTADPARGREKETVLVETKSCNLVEDGVALFPDAPTERGARHLYDLIRAVKEGHRGAVVWFVQRDDAKSFAPHRVADPAFGEAFDAARAAGVEAYAWRCRVSPEGIEVLDAIPVLPRHD